MSIRVVAWNLNFWPRRAQDRSLVWWFLRHELRADVALVQESEPPPEDVNGLVGGPIGGSRDWGTYVVGFTHRVTAVAEAKGAYSTSGAPLRSWQAGTAAVAKVEDVPLTVVSLYGLQENGYASPAVNRHLADMTLLLDDPAHVGTLVVGGDLNITTQWTGSERAYRDIEKAQLGQFEAFCLTELVADRAPGPLEGCGCADGAACRHQLTHWQANSERPWQDDYLFVSNRLASKVDFMVVPRSEVEHLSDHAPLVAEFDL